MVKARRYGKICGHGKSRACREPVSQGDRVVGQYRGLPRPPGAYEGKNPILVSRCAGSLYSEHHRAALADALANH